MSDPTDPISNLLAGAIGLHELMLSYVEAGFTRTEAHALVCTVMAATINSQGRQ